MVDHFHQVLTYFTFLVPNKDNLAKKYIFRALRSNIPMDVVLVVMVVDVDVVVIGAQQSNPSGNSAPQLSKLS